jgi:hypothetical protein
MATPETFPFDDSSIEPRPLFSERPPEPVAPPVIVPPEPPPTSIKGIPEKDGPTQSEILLQGHRARSQKRADARDHGCNETDCESQLRVRFGFLTFPSRLQMPRDQRLELGHLLA